MEKGDVTNAVSQTLKGCFENYKIYKEPVLMGFKVPCFFINCDKLSVKKAYGKRYFVSVKVYVYCCMGEKKKTDELEEIRFKLLNDFNFISLGGKKVSVSEKNFDVTDENLMFSFNLNFHVLKEEEKEIMQTLIKN